MLKKISCLLVSTLIILSNLFAENDPQKQEEQISLSTYKLSGGFARVWSFGYDFPVPAYQYNFFIKDPFFISFNPALSSSYSNFLWGDIGSNAGDDFGGFNQNAGFLFEIQDGLTLGALLSRNDYMGGPLHRIDPYGIISTINSNRPGPNVITPANNLTFIGSYELEEDFSIGFGLSYISSSNEVKPAGQRTFEANYSQFGISVGSLYKLDQLYFDGSLSMIFMSADSKDPNTRTFEGSASNFNLLGRTFYEYANNLNFVGVLQYVTSSGSVKDRIVNGTSTTSDLSSKTYYSLSAGINYSKDRFLFAGGITYACSSTTFPKVRNVSPELTNSDCYFPLWQLGLEYLAVDWLILRAGYISANLSTTLETAASSTTKNKSSYNQYLPGGVNLGIGLRFGTFSLDAFISEEVLRQGFNLIGGGTRTFAYISASYAF